MKRFKAGLYLAPLAAIGLFGALLAAPTDTLAGDKKTPAGMIELQVRDVVPIEEAGSNAVMLVTSEGTVLPVFVDQGAAVAIAFRLAKRPAPYPLAQDLLDEMVIRLGGKVLEVHLGDVQDELFGCEVVIRHRGKELKLALRASDAISMALKSGAKIYASDALVSASGITRDEIEELRMGIGGSGPPEEPAVPSEGGRPAAPGEITL